MLGLCERDLIQSSDGDKTYFVARICYERNKLALVDRDSWFKKDSQYKKPKVITFSNLEDWLTSGKYKREGILSLPSMMLKSDKWLENADKYKWLVKRDKGIKLISKIIETDELLNAYIFDDGPADEIKEIQKSTNKKSPTSVYRLLNRYIAFGSVKNALLPISYARCGNRTVHDDSEKRPTKRGRKTRVDRHGRKVPCRSKTRGITAQDKLNILRLLKEREISNRESYKRYSPKKLWEDYLSKYSSYVIIRESGTGDDYYAWAFDEEDRISENQFYYHLRELLSDEELLLHKLGQVNFEKDEKVKTGLARDGIIGPGYCYAIDATTLDVYVRYSYSRKIRSCGRPVLYLVVDVWSTCIVGYYIGFHGPDWVGAGEALYHACINKSSWAKSIGWNLEDDAWLCHHVPHRVLGDNGSEYSEYNIRSMLEAEIGIKMMDYAPIYRGDAKGVVERMFKVLNDNFLHFQPGYVPKFALREMPHAANNSIWTYRDLVIAIGKEIVFHNNNVSRLKKHNFIMARDYAGITPQAIYNYGIEKEMNGGRIVTDKSKLRFAFLREEEATVYGNCVVHNGLEYEYPRGRELGIYGKAKYKGSYRIPVRLTNSTTNHLWHRDDNGKIVELTLNDPDHWARNQLREMAYERLNEYEAEAHNLAQQAIQNRMQLNFEHSQSKAISGYQVLASPKRKGMPAGMGEAKMVMIEENHMDIARSIKQDLKTQDLEVFPTSVHDIDNELYDA